MKLFWLDASALAKRYVSETGTPLMNYFFSRVPPLAMICLLEGIGEVISIFVRQKNAGRITGAEFTLVLIELRAEISHRAEVAKIHPTADQVSACWDLIARHAINSTDAVILRCALDKATELRADGHDLVLVSADARLLRAARSEGLLTFNPETDSQATLDSF